MKIRNGFVSNSSSSSFILVKAGAYVIAEDGDDDSGNFETDTMSLNIDSLIETLLKAKSEGAKQVTFEYGGGYDG